MCMKVNFILLFLSRPYGVCVSMLLGAVHQGMVQCTCTVGTQSQGDTCVHGAAYQYTGSMYLVCIGTQPCTRVLVHSR